MISSALNQAIETAKSAEELGIIFYTDLDIKYSNQKNLKIVFELLAYDEVEYKKQFQDLIPGTANIFRELPEDEILYSRGCNIAGFFPKMEEMLSDFSIEEVLKHAFEFEKESLLFKPGIKDLPGVYDKLDFIIDSEKEHMTKLMKNMISERKFRGSADYS